MSFLDRFAGVFHFGSITFLCCRSAQSEEYEVYVNNVKLEELDDSVSRGRSLSVYTDNSNAVSNFAYLDS